MTVRNKSAAYLSSREPAVNERATGQDKQPKKSSNVKCLATRYKHQKKESRTQFSLRNEIRMLRNEQREFSFDNNKKNNLLCSSESSS